MNRIEEIGRQMPMRESKEYVNDLVNRCAERAITEAPKRRRAAVRRICYAASAAAAIAVLVVVLTLPYVNKMRLYDAINDSQTLTQVLSTMSDEEVMGVSYYSMDDIPEY